MQANTFTQDVTNKVRAIKGGFEALDGRDEQSRSLLTSLTRGLWYDKDAAKIDTAGMLLNKYVGANPLNKMSKNADNRISLRMLLSTEANNMASAIMQKADAEDDIYSSFKARALAQKLSSIPISHLSDRVVYEILDELDNLSSSVSSGVPIGIAITKGDSINAINNKYEDYIAHVKAQSLGALEEGIGTFLKTGFNSSVTGLTGFVDSLMNLPLIASGSDIRNILTKQIQKILPDVSPEEYLSNSGKIGSFVGGNAAALALYGVPKTPTDAAKFLGAPYAIDFLREHVGLDNDIIDASIGLFNAKHLYSVVNNNNLKANNIEDTSNSSGDMVSSQKALSLPEYRSNAANELKAIAEVNPEAAENIVKDVRNNSRAQEGTEFNRDTIVNSREMFSQLLHTTAEREGTINSDLISGKVTEHGKVMSECLANLMGSNNPEYVENGRMFKDGNDATLSSAAKSAIAGSTDGLPEFVGTPEIHSVLSDSIRDILIESKSKISGDYDLYRDQLSNIENMPNFKSEIQPSLVSELNKFMENELSSLNERIDAGLESSQFAGSELVQKETKLKLIEQAVPDFKQRVSLAKLQLQEGGILRSFETLKSLDSDMKSEARSFSYKQSDLRKKTGLNEAGKLAAGIEDHMLESAGKYSKTLKKQLQFANERNARINRILRESTGSKESTLRYYPDQIDGSTVLKNILYGKNLQNLNKELINLFPNNTKIQGAVDLLSRGLKHYAYNSVVGNKPLSFAKLNTLRNGERFKALFNAPVSQKVFNDISNSVSTYEAYLKNKFNPSGTATKISNMARSALIKSKLGFVVDFFSGEHLEKANEYISSINNNPTIYNQSKNISDITNTETFVKNMKRRYSINASRRRIDDEDRR